MNTLGRLYNLIQNQMPAQTLEDITSILWTGSTTILTKVVNIILIIRLYIHMMNEPVAVNENILGDDLHKYMNRICNYTGRKI